MKKHVVTGPIRCLSQCHPVTVTDEYKPDVSTDTFWNTRIVSHNNNKHMNSARKFPGDFANFQKISRISTRKNNSSWFPGVLDTLLQYCNRTVSQSEVKVEWGLMSNQTHYWYRSYQGQVFMGQMTQPTVSKH